MLRHVLTYDRLKAASFVHSAVYVILLTRQGTPEERVRGLSAGADDFVTRPYDPAELLARVRSLLRIKAFHDTVLGSVEPGVAFVPLKDVSHTSLGSTVATSCSTRVQATSSARVVSTVARRAARSASIPSTSESEAT